MIEEKHMNLIEFFGTTVKPKITKGKNMLNPIPTGKITEGVFCIRDKDVNVFLIKTKNYYIAIDSGYKNSENLIKGLKELNIDRNDVKYLFLTHLDLDHAGGVDGRCNNIFPNAKIFLGKEEEKYLKSIYFRKKVLFFNLKTPIKIFKDYTCLEDRETVNLDENSIEAILTPGHTLGHLTYILNDKIIFSGDCLIMNSEGGYSMYDLWNIDTAQNIRSLFKLKEIAFQKKCEMLISSHTGFTADIEKAFKHIDEAPNWKAKGFKFIENAIENLYE